MVTSVDVDVFDVEIDEPVLVERKIDTGLRGQTKAGIIVDGGQGRPRRQVLVKEVGVVTPAPR